MTLDFAEIQSPRHLNVVDTTDLSVTWLGLRSNIRQISQWRVAVPYSEDACANSLANQIKAMVYQALPLL